MSDMRLRPKIEELDRKAYLVLIYGYYGWELGMISVFFLAITFPALVYLPVIVMCFATSLLPSGTIAFFVRYLLLLLLAI